MNRTKRTITESTRPNPARSGWTIGRRDFMIAASAAVLAPPLSRASGRTELVAQPFEAQILPRTEYAATRCLGFNGSLPGPELRTVQGQPVDILLRNKLDQGTAVHWHGVRLHNAMDGVPNLTQDIVQPDETFAYRFTPRDAGTFWYHSHHLSHEQVARGLMGPLIVEPDNPPDVDHDVTAMLVDWRLDQTGQLTDDFANMHDVAHAGRMGNIARALLPELQLRRGERIRLRLINAAVDRIFQLDLSGLNGKLVAVDGMPLAQIRDLEGIELAPAQRADVIADVETLVEIHLVAHGDRYRLGKLDVVGQVPSRAAPIPTLPPNEISPLGAVSQDLSLVMQGGAMGKEHGGDGVWAFNDVSDLPTEPLASLKRGETSRLRLVNDTRFPHGIHIDGHHFFDVNDDHTLGDLRDTTLVHAGQSRDILCVFDNPGRWMLHCHMLSHQMGGMKTWIEVL